MLIPAKLYLWDDALQTVENIRNQEALFRLGIACGLAGFVAYLLLPLVLYRLLQPVNPTAAVLMVALAVVSVPVTFMNTGNLFEVLRLLHGTGVTVPYGDTHLAREVMHRLWAWNDGNLIAQLFWGTWLFPFGYLVFQSGFLPKILGLFLMAGSVGYTLDFFGRVLWPEYPQSLLAGIITIPASIGEIGTCLWLLVMGTRTQAPSSSGGSGPA